MLSEDLQIYRDTYELCRLLFIYQNDVPRSARYGEYGRAVSMSLEALDLIYVANSDVMRRPAALMRFLQILGGIRSRVRLFGELRYLSIRRVVNLSLLAEKIGKQATGWRNSSHGVSRGVKCNTGEPNP